MTDEKTRTIRRWNDSRIGENPIRARRRSNDPHKKALLADRSRRAALSARQRGEAFWGHGLVETTSTRDAFKPSPPPQKPLTDRVEQNPGTRSSFDSERPSPLNQVNDQDNDRNYEQQMDQSSAHMTEKTEKPENDENYKYSPQHRFYFRLISSQGLCATLQQKDQKQNRNGNSEKPKQNVSGRTGLFDSIR
jgi:hypothetical protein